MANKNDCAVCKQMMKKKHRFDLFYKIGFWVVTVLLAIVSTLYFSSGEVFTHEVVNKEIENNIDIDNIGSDNTNNVNINQ